MGGRRTGATRFAPSLAPPTLVTIGSRRPRPCDAAGRGSLPAVCRPQPRAETL